MASIPSLPSFQPLRSHFLAPETATVDKLVSLARLDVTQAGAVNSEARRLVEAVRTRQKADAGMQSFLTEYDLSSQEGVLLMCVAEALLRIPDAATADKLIKDKFSQGDWSRHFGRSDSMLVNAGTWGMMLTGRLVAIEPSSIADVGSWLGRLAARAGEPVVRLALRQPLLHEFPW